MKRAVGNRVLITVIGFSATLSLAGPPTVAEPNSYVASGALRLDVGRDIDSQLPEGWRPTPLDPHRLVKFSGPVGSRHRERLAAAGYTVVSYLPDNTFLVRPERREPEPLSSIEGVSWTGPFHPYFKITYELGRAIETGDVSSFVEVERDWGLRFSVGLHEADTRSTAEAHVAAAPGVVRVLSTRTLPIRVEVEPKHFAAFLQSVAALPEVAVIEPWIPSHDANDENVQSTQSGNCVADGAEAANTSIFNRGITGWNARLVVADSCTDANSGYWYDDALGRLPAHEANAPWNAVEPDWSQRKIIEYYDLHSQDTQMGCPDADQDHGTVVAGTMTANCSLDVEGIATRTDPANSDGDQDGMAPGAYVIVHDHNFFGYHGDGGTLGEMFDIAFDNTCLDADCGIDAHNNSWGGGGTAYITDSRTGDASLWRTMRGLIVTAIGNNGSSYGSGLHTSMGKNVVSVGRSPECSVDSVSVTSSRGPAGDGRLKPEVVACGSDVTTVNNDGDGTTNANQGCVADVTTGGTSLSAPTVAGLSALVLQYFNDGFHPGGTATPFDALEPSGPLMKAMLINTAQRMTDASTAERNGVGWPNNDQGWGVVVLENSLSFPGDTRKLWIHDEAFGIDVTESSTSMTFRRRVTSSAEPLKVTLAWYDTPHATSCGPGVPCLNNDLDLTVTEPISGDTWTATLVAGTAGHVVPRTVVPGGPVGAGQTTTDNGPDDLNPVEQIIIYDPTPDRIYELTVTAANTPDGPVPFALVATGALDEPCSGPTGSSPITAGDVTGCSAGGVQVSWNQDVTSWNDGGSGARSYRVWRDGMPIRSGPCAGNLPYGTTGCVDDGAPATFPADYRVEYFSGCGATTKSAEVAATDAVLFFVDVTPETSETCPGGDLVFTAAADAPGSYTYQWTEDGIDLPGQTSSTLTISQGVPGVHGYNCRVTDAGACTNAASTPGVGTWLEPGDVGHDGNSSPFVSRVELCGDGDAFVERGEIWSIEVGLINDSPCGTAAGVTAELQVNISEGLSEVCNPQGEFGDLGPLAGAADTFAFRVDATTDCPSQLDFDVVNIAWEGGGPNNDFLAFNIPVGGNCGLVADCDCEPLVVDEVSAAGEFPLTVTRNGSLVDLKFQRVTEAERYNAYVSTDASTLPFQVTDPGAGKLSCDIPWQSQFGGTAISTGFDVEGGIDPGQAVYYILVTGDQGPTTEGPLGLTSDAIERDADSRCAD